MSCQYKDECPNYSGWCEGPKQDFSRCVQFLITAYENAKNKLQEYMEKSTSKKKADKYTLFVHVGNDDYSFRAGTLYDSVDLAIGAVYLDFYYDTSNKDLTISELYELEDGKGFYVRVYELPNTVYRTYYILRTEESEA